MFEELRYLVRCPTCQSEYLLKLQREQQFHGEFTLNNPAMG